MALAASRWKLRRDSPLLRDGGLLSDTISVAGSIGETGEYGQGSLLLTWLTGTGFLVMLLGREGGSGSASVEKVSSSATSVFSSSCALW